MTTQDITWQRGQTEEWTLTITTSGGAPENLSDALAVELEVKQYFGRLDPASLHLDATPGGGIVVRPQTGADVGVCDLTATAAQTFVLTGGDWAYDVFVTRADGARKRAMSGKLTVTDAVNFP